MDQRDGVTAVTATRYPPARRKRRKGEGRQGPRAAGGGGRAPSRRHGRHSLPSGTRSVVLAAVSWRGAVWRCCGFGRVVCRRALIGFGRALAGFSKRSPARALKRREPDNCPRFLVVFSFCF
jgi:hypothetical protein